MTRATYSRYLLGLAGASVLLGVLHVAFGDFEAGGVSWFDLDRERNLPTWFSGLLFMLFGLAALAAYHVESRHNAAGGAPFRLPALWLGVALVGFYMSLDEITILHENLFWREVRIASAGRGDAWQYLTQWQIVFAPALFAAVAYFALFFTNRFAASRRALGTAFAGVGCWVVAVALEGIRSALRGESGAGYGIEVVVEEELELAGALCLVAAIVSYVSDIALDLDAKRRRKLALGERFLTRRAVVALAACCGALVLSAGTMYAFAVRQAAAGAPVPALFRQALAGVEVPRRGGAEIWFDDIGDRVPLPAVDDATLERFLRERLLPSRRTGEIFQELERDDAPRVAILSVGDGTKPARVVRGSGRGLVQALDRVAAAAGPGWEQGWARLDLVDRVDADDRVDFRPPLAMERGLHGLAFDRRAEIAFAPGELAAYDLVNDDLEVQPRAMLELLRRRDPRVAERFTAMLAPRTPVPYRFFTTRSWFLDGAKWVPLYRGHRTFADPTPAELLEAARRAGRYLVRSVLPDGRFVYSYEAGQDRVSSDYNMLRHAGTTYAVLELYEVTREADLLEAARRAIAYLLTTIHPCQHRGREYSCVVDDGAIKLGGNALAVIALAKYQEVTQDAAHRDVRRQLVRWIQAVQSPSGEFEVHKQTHGEDEASDFLSDYYPGEALLALLRLYALERDESLLDSAERGARWLIEVRDGNKRTEQLDHDHWLLYALNELHRRRPAPRYLDHAGRIAAAIVQAQLRDAKFPDWTGGWYQPPRSTPAAVRSEGLASAWALAHDFGRPREAQTMLEALTLGVRFQMQTQIGPEQALYFPDPQRPLGGFHRSLTSYEIRNDYVQHNISALLALARVLEREGAQAQ